jgi:MoxR-like ATPase
MTQLRNEAVKVIDALEAHDLFVNRPDMQLGDRKYNSAALLGTAVALAGGTGLIYGDPGLGKTTSCERIGALTYGLPEDFIQAAEIHCSPEQTEEKMLARPDLGALNQGKEKVIWNSFVYSPVKIVDELNRLPETKQSTLLNGLARGLWTYLNDTVKSPKGVSYATVNYPDRGTGTLIPPMADRFTVSYEAKHMGPAASFALASSEYNGGSEALEDPETTLRILNALADQTTSFSAKLEMLEKESEKIRDRFREDVGAGLSIKDRREARKEIDGVKISTNGFPYAFATYLLSEFVHSDRYGQIRTHEEPPAGDHFEQHLSNAVRTPASQRLAKSLALMSKTLAWLDGQPEVGMDHLTTVAPYVISHRVALSDKYLNEKGDEQRTDHKNLHVAKVAVGEVQRDFESVKVEVNNAMADIVEVQAIENKKTRKEKAQKLARELKALDKPFFHQLAMDVEGLFT